MQPQDVFRILSTATVTHGLKPDELKLLLSYAVIETVPPGWMVLAEGQHSESLYVVLSGRLKVMLLAVDHKDYPNRVQDIHLNTLKPGDCFGEYGKKDQELDLNLDLLEEAGSVISAGGGQRRAVEATSPLEALSPTW